MGGVRQADSSLDLTVIMGNKSSTQNKSVDKKAKARRKLLAKSPIDLEICASTDSQCFGGSARSQVNINECIHLQRMLKGIKYYQLLNMDANPSNGAILMDFCQNVYSELLNDYHHIISTHSTQNRSYS